MRTFLKFGFSITIILVLVLGYSYLRQPLGLERTKMLGEWLHSTAKHPEWTVQANQGCPDAPFVFPTDGVIGFIWDDSFYPGHHHQGLDIFGGTDPGKTEVVAAFQGYLTRLAEWRSSLIIRIPDDPLRPGHQIWTYYTHLADSQGNSLIADAFQPGIREIYVKAGTFLGRQGNYSGKPGEPVGVHLHFSIVNDDGNGNFLNELKIQNTLDPSPYFLMNLNASTNPSSIPICQDIIEKGVR
jgi:murein DD-endopeptidase MepM/ murein hydrolase activator NlpD